MTSDTLAAVLWDMDGTLIDSEPLWLEAELKMLARFNITMSEATHKQLVGSGLRDAAEHFRELGVPLSVDDIVAEWVAGVGENLRHTELQWRPGARELLADLKAHAIPCALVTMSVRSLAEAVVAQLPEGTFQCIIAGDEVTHEKPHPEPYLLGAQALGVDVRACIALEDSPTGLTSASSAGAFTIGVPNLLPLDLAPHDALLPSLAGVDTPKLSSFYRGPRGAEHVHAQTEQEACQ